MVTNLKQPFWIILPALALGVFVLWVGFTAPAWAGVASAPAGGVPDIALDTFATGLSSPVDIENAGDTRLFIVEQAGRIRIVESNGTVLGTPFLDIMDRVDDGGEQGLLGLTFDPNYESNGYFYVNYTHCTASSCPDYGLTPSLYTRISRFTVTGDANVANPNSELILLVVQQPYGNHNAGDLNFGSDGYLYVGLGDGGSGGDPGNRAQNGMELLGKMLRLDVHGGGQAPDCYPAGQYTVPADNPFVGTANTCDEIWNFGLRNPWRFSFDSLTHDMYIGDVGQNLWEEVNFQPASSNGGENWGWRCYEGTHEYDPFGCGLIGDYDFPFYEYPHSGGSCSVTGGYVYRGNLYPVFYGHYIFTDYCSGQTWTADGNLTVTAQGDLGGSFTSFGEDVDGEIYLASSNGTIYHVIENTIVQTPTPTSLPTTLTPTPTSSPTPTPTSTPKVHVQPVATGFSEPVDVVNAGDERLFVAERTGLVYEVSGEGAVIPEPVLAITDRVGTDFWEQGLLSIAFHPDFANNPYLYTQYTDLNGDIVISRFTVSGTITTTVPLQPIDTTTEWIILQIDHPDDSLENNGGELAFGPDGYLYISVGDGGNHTEGQDIQSLLGKILRVDVSITGSGGISGGAVAPDCYPSGQYTIPADNPLVAEPNACDEIWALGFRNPWRYSFDSLTGELYIGDVGEDSYEEISLQPADSTGGENFGWSCYEGSHPSPHFDANTCTDTYVNPIHDYDHSVGRTVVGGYVYRGCQYADMVGKYYFADYVYGNLWSLESDGSGGYNVEELLVSSQLQFSSFGEGVDGELYLLEYSNGTLFHLTGNQWGECFVPYNLWIPVIFNP